MRAGLAGIAVLAACGSRPAPQIATANERPSETTARKTIQSFPAIAVPRPELDVEHLVPDFHEELRWPLSPMSHPELAPQFNIAPVFAQSGIGWIELCERGVQNRITSGRNRDELDYLRGWCSAIKGDADAACSRLAPLTSTTVLGMPAAVRSDLANIIANAGNIDVADKLLKQHHIDNIQILDLLAATYVEIGQERDAFEVNRRALDSYGHTTSAQHCHRLVKHLVLGARDDVSALAALENSATKPKVPDPTCMALHDAIMCWRGPASNCHAYFRAESIDTRHTHLLAAYRHWPRAATYEVWIEIVEIATLAAGLPGAMELAEPALEAAMRSAPSCKPAVLRAISRYIKVWPSARLRAEAQRCRWDPDA